MTPDLHARIAEWRENTGPATIYCEIRAADVLLEKLLDALEASERALSSNRAQLAALTARAAALTEALDWMLSFDMLPADFPNEGDMVAWVEHRNSLRALSTPPVEEPR